MDALYKKVTVFLSFCLFLLCLPVGEKAIFLPLQPTLTMAWEAEWEKTKAEARKEGTVSLYSIWPPPARAAVTKGFKNRFGLDLEVTPFRFSSDLFAKAQSEKTAGLKIVDAFGTGGSGLTFSGKPQGLIRQIEPLLILPEVVNPKAWAGGEIPYYDKDKYIIGMSSTPNRLVFCNKDFIKEGEITSLKDLLKPQYKGKIVMGHPGRGGGIFLFTHIAQNVWNLKEASEFYTRIIKDQEAVVVNDQRQQAEWIARGKYPIGFAVGYTIIVKHLKLGAPISQPMLKEPQPSSPGRNGLGVSVNSPHPNATRVFVNWILSKEGQTILSQSSQTPSKRVDCPTEGVPPSLFPRSGEKMCFASEELALVQGKLRKVVDKLVAEAQK